MFEIGDPAVPALIEVLQNKSEDNEVRYVVIVVLQDLKTPKAFDALVEVLQEDESPSIRHAAARAMGPIGDQRAVPYLMESIKDPYLPVRFDSIGSLRLLRNDSSIPAFIEALDDEHESVREFAKDALKQFGINASELNETN